MQESAACAVLKARFEAAGFRITENSMFEEDGIRFEMDGFDPERRVGYEYVTAEAGDGWDVDGDVIAKLAERKERGELFVLVVDEADAPDEQTLRDRADAFLADVPKPGDDDEDANKDANEDDAETDETETPMAKKAAAKKKPAKKPAAKKPAAKKPAAKKKKR